MDTPISVAQELIDLQTDISVVGSANTIPKAALEILENSVKNIPHPPTNLFPLPGIGQNIDLYA